MAPNHPHGDEEAALEIKRVSPDEVANIVRAAPARTAVVDVREEDDWLRAHVKGAVHAPTSAFDAKVQGLVDQFKSHERVVFHCGYSKQRGPKCAAAFKKALEERFPESKTEIVVLKGGFINFEQQFAADSALFDGTPSAPTK